MRAPPAERVEEWLGGRAEMNLPHISINGEDDCAELKNAIQWKRECLNEKEETYRKE